MKANNIISDYIFSRNPVILSFPGGNDADGRETGSFEICFGYEEIYRGRFYPPVDIDVSEIVDSFLPSLSDPPEHYKEPILNIEDDGTFANRMFTVSFHYGAVEEEYSAFALPGGVSKQNFRRYAELGTDAFQSRFLNANGNFFLSTRTSGWRLIMKETELYPLYFVADCGGVIVAEDVATGKRYEMDYESGINILDIDNLRKKFWDEMNILPNVFDIYRDNTYSCRIIVEESEPAKERYRLKYRNSFGAFEILELTGKLTYEPEFDTEEAFGRYDGVSGSYYNCRERVERSSSFSIDTGVRLRRDLESLMDMLASDEVYLLDVSDNPLNVLPSIESMSYAKRPEVPMSFTLKLELPETESNIMADINGSTDSSKQRIFTKEFSKQFN
ncbi:MAG: hypothetical protein K2L89_06020 [Muribaculaceae bacterium]|nr:hypothetical protein [Muribaculaceae bacterium]